MQDKSKQPLPQLPPRDADGHKGTYGRLLLVGGSRGMAGSISLTGMAALRSGAGLVTIATPRCVQATVASFCPAYMTIGLADNGEAFSGAAEEPLMELAEKADVVAIGPGLGESDELDHIVGRLKHELRQPVIIDADGLNALVRVPLGLDDSGGPRILTPHPGEYGRLIGEKVEDDLDLRPAQARSLADTDLSNQTVVVLKGAGTVVADSERYAINATGNPGMATGGTGDVLTGVIAALAAQGLDPWDAARLGVYVHGLAGDLAAEDLGQVSLMAPDLLDYLPGAFQQVSA